LLKLIYIGIMFLYISCSTEPIYKDVFVNKTIKVFSNKYHDKAENYTFKWEPPLDENNLPINFDLKNDMFIFTPEKEGKYIIRLSITDISDELIAKENFYFKAKNEDIDSKKIKYEDKKINDTTIENTNSSKQIEQNKVKIKKKKLKKNKKKNKKNYYTIQISAWPTLKEARTEQIKLIEEGFDAYISRKYQNKYDAIWYRVRIGNFKNKSDATKFQKQVESITNKKSWIDIISEE